MPTIANFLYTQLVLRIPKPTASFAHKTVVITGANGGLGKEITKHVVRLGASRVIFACRNMTRAKEAQAEIEAELNCSREIIQPWELDIESASSIKSFVDKAQGLSRIDVLVSNAGVQRTKFQRSYETESCVGINVIGTWLLAIQLLPKLRETSAKFNVAPHVTFVGSALYDVAKWPEEPIDDIFDWSDDEKNMHFMQYGFSKLLSLLAAIHFSAKIQPKDPKASPPVIVNSIDPCFCSTGLHDLASASLQLRILEFLFARPAREGAALVVQAAAAGEETHGKYFRAGAVEEYAPIAQDPERAKLVWNGLVKRLEAAQPGVLQYLQ